MQRNNKANIRFKTGNLNMRNLDTISTRMLGHIFYDLNISPQHTLLSTSLPRCFWALQAKILDNVELNYRKSRHFSNLPRFCQMNAINNVHHLKSCISLNKRFWAKSFFGNLQKSFCRIDLKFKSLRIGSGG